MIAARMVETTAPTIRTPMFLAVLDSFVVAHSILQTSVSERNTGYSRVSPLLLGARSAATVRDLTVMALGQKPPVCHPTDAGNY